MTETDIAACRPACRLATRIGLYCVAIGLSTLAVVSTTHLIAGLALTEMAKTLPEQQVRAAEVIQTSDYDQSDDAWFQQIRAGQFSIGRSVKDRGHLDQNRDVNHGKSLQKPVLLESRENEFGSGAVFYNGSGDTYRTMCVRSCDGSFFPISFSTTRNKFRADERRCQSQCGTDAKLYVYRTPSENVESMKNLRGRPYVELPTAFLFRAAYNPNCKCRPHAWEEATRTRHKTYGKIADLKSAKRTKTTRRAIRALSKDLKRTKKASRKAATQARKRELASLVSGAKASAGGKGPAARFSAPLRQSSEVTERFYTPMTVLAANEAVQSGTVLIPQGASRSSSVIPTTWSKYASAANRDAAGERPQRRRRQRFAKSWGSAMGIGVRSSSERSGGSRRSRDRSWKARAFASNR